MKKFYYENYQLQYFLPSLALRYIYWKNKHAVNVVENFLVTRP